MDAVAMLSLSINRPNHTFRMSIHVHAPETFAKQLMAPTFQFLQSIPGFCRHLISTFAQIASLPHPELQPSNSPEASPSNLLYTYPATISSPKPKVSTNHTLEGAGGGRYVGSNSHIPMSQSLDTNFHSLRPRHPSTRKYIQNTEFILPLPYRINQPPHRAASN